MEEKEDPKEVRIQELIDAVRRYWNSYKCHCDACDCSFYHSDPMLLICGQCYSHASWLLRQAAMIAFMKLYSHETGLGCSREEFIEEVDRNMDGIDMELERRRREAIRLNK